MKKLILSIFALVAALGNSHAQNSVKPCIPEDTKMEAEIESRLAKMTIDEKVGQMCELSIDIITDAKGSTGGKFLFNNEKVNEVFDKYKVGSILNVPLSVAQPPESWRKIIYSLNQKSLKSFGIPEVYGVDQIHGASYTLGATFFPQPICQAASFNRNIPFRVSEISAYESRDCLIPWVYAPVMDLGRQPMWSRMWESFGEDCYVNSEMAAQAVEGFQGTDPNHIDMYHVGACIKHFMAYGVPVNGKDRTPSSVSERDLREKYFMPFKNCLQHGALSLMVNSSLNNGIPFHANKELLTDWVKNELNWDGMIVTDWADIDNLYKRDHIAANKKDAIALAINAGIDMSMDPYDVGFCTDLNELVQEGRVPMSRIDDAVRRILRFKYRIGLFDEKTWNNPDKIAKKYPDFACKKFADEATEFAEEGEVLLKNNDNILPLAKGKKILVAGPNANSLRTINGGWSYTWQGNKTDELVKGKYNTIYDALCNKYGKDNVTLCQGVTYKNSDNWQDENAPEIDKAVSAAADADVIIACVGENSYCETPGNLEDINMSANQRDLVKALAKTDKPIILILNGGRPRVMGDIEPLAKAVVDVFLPGNYGGDALANLLAGDANFSAKMPFTYPHHVSSLHTYDYKPCENLGEMAGSYNYDAKMDIQWPFGYGLSYTTFKYSNLKVNKTDFTADDELEFTVDVTNTGSVEGKEVAMLYSSELVASISPDNKRLRNFEKVDLKPGETKTVTMKIKASDLAFVGIDNKWVLEQGEFVMRCGDQLLHINCTQTKHWDTPNI